MQNLTYQELFNYIGEHIIKPFYQVRLDRLNELKLNDVLKRKNPYLFKAKNITTVQDLVTEILQAHISSQEETVFGNYLEDLAIYVGSCALCVVAEGAPYGRIQYLKFHPYYPIESSFHVVIHPFLTVCRSLPRGCASRARGTDAGAEIESNERCVS